MNLARNNPYSKGLITDAMDLCDLIEDGINQDYKWNVSEITKPCTYGPPFCYDFSQAEKFLNQEEVQRVLGVKPSTQWVSCNEKAKIPLLDSDDSRSMQSEIIEILDKSDVHVLTYSGDKDWMVNWRQGEDWTAATKWKHQAHFNA